MPGKARAAANGCDWLVCRHGALLTPTAALLQVNRALAPLPSPRPAQVFTITTPVEQEGAAEQLVRRLSPGARLTYSLGGTRKYELPVGEVTLPGERAWTACSSGKGVQWEE